MNLNKGNKALNRSLVLPSFSSLTKAQRLILIKFLIILHYLIHSQEEVINKVTKIFNLIQKILAF